MAARRLPGFIVARTITGEDKYVRSLAPAHPSKTRKTLDRIKQVRASFFYALVLFGFVYPLCLFFLCDGEIRRRTCAPETGADGKARAAYL